MIELAESNDDTSPDDGPNRPRDAVATVLDRLGLEDRLRQAVAQAERTGEQVAVHLIEVDWFDRMTHRFGAAKADALLAATRASLATLVRRSDGLAWFGDACFAVVQRSVQAAEGVAALGRKLLTAVGEAHLDSRLSTRLSASVGIGLHEPGLSWAEVLANAEQALRRAQSEGGSTFRIYRSPRANARQARVVLLEQLHRALEQDQLFLEFQPQISARSGRTVAFEALVRWQHPQRGVVQPGCFLPAAESSGLIVDIGRWVLENACRQCKLWNEGLAVGVPVAVNASPLEIGHSGFADRVTSALERAGLEPKLLELELTESAYVRDLPAMREEIALLRQRGVRLAIDDFAMGFASFRYLRSFPVDKVKIPREFIDARRPDATDRALIEAIVQVGHRLDLSVTAEGVETAEQVAALRAAGCDALQGFLLGRPAALPVTTAPEETSKTAGAAPEQAAASASAKDTRSVIKAPLRPNGTRRPSRHARPARGGAAPRFFGWAADQI